MLSWPERRKMSSSTFSSSFSCKSPCPKHRRNIFNKTHLPVPDLLLLTTQFSKIQKKRCNLRMSHFSFFKVEHHHFQSELPRRKHISTPITFHQCNKINRQPLVHTFVVVLCIFPLLEHCAIYIR